MLKTSPALPTLRDTEVSKGAERIKLLGIELSGLTCINNECNWATMKLCLVVMRRQRASVSASSVSVLTRYSNRGNDHNADHPCNTLLEDSILGIIREVGDEKESSRVGPERKI